MKPSPTQLGVLVELANHGGVIERWPGGFWTWPDCAYRSTAFGKVPTWHAGTATVRAMTRAGWLEADPETRAALRYGGPVGDAPRRLTPAGLAAVPKTPVEEPPKRGA